MKRFLAIALLLVVGLVASAQNYPSEWKQFTSDGYFHDIESGTSKQSALELARTNLAHKIQMRVKEVSQMDKQVVNGRSSILYTSSKSFSTDLDMNLVESKTYYNDDQDKFYVLVYIDKVASTTYYENDLKMLINNSGNALTIADNYISSGFKQKAKAELQKALQQFDNAGKAFFWLNIFGFNENRIQSYLKQVNEREQIIKQKISELEYGTTYCVVCNAEIFGKRYFKLANEIKGDLSAQGCNFVDDVQSADIVIRIQASARKYNQYQGAYFTYIDAAVTIDKNATGQRIFEDEVSVKGAHTLSFDEAARDGYKEIRKELTKLLKENIKQ